MRSRSSYPEDPTRTMLRTSTAKTPCPAAGKLGRSQRGKVYAAETNTILRSPRTENPRRDSSPQRDNLSRDDLLFLLSILEGELQARDEVIGVLKAEKMDLALLEAQYGFVTPKKVLEALQRDAIQAKAAQWQEDIYEKPMNELDRVAEKQKESYRRMLEQLLMVEKAHRQSVRELEEEKRKHKEYTERSDEFISLLEQECESFTRKEKLRDRTGKVGLMK
ncbi:filamin A-interacting protein 1-like [Tachyglossus aculeatus]|uniref:filamin A-interacting protein 1-like n=1 Tax=Tachyglossus aculeatus TaxID=9261 RepID=UPI0018F4DE23|nr:filamin A-interacting protein 1-like [Tachyglossus aculeatus]